MSLANSLGLFTLTVFCFVGTAPSQAQNRGQADLDRATELQVSVQTLADLERVAKLCDSALRKGLDGTERKFAEQLLSSTLFEHATRLCAPFLVRPPVDASWLTLRRAALADLERAIKIDPQLVDAHLLIAGLHALPGGDRERGKTSAAMAVRLYEEQQDQQQAAAALLLHAQLQDEAAQRLQDYDRAIQLDPGNAAAWEAHAMTCAEQGDFAKAVEDFNKLLQDHADNAAAHFALGEVLIQLEKYDEAEQHIERVIQLQPESPLGFLLRAELHLAKKEVKVALNDLDQALQVNPRDVRALLIRAEVRQEEGDLAAAKDDVDRVLGLRPDLPEGVILRSLLSAAEGRLVDAIADMESLLERDATNVSWRLQLASYYLQDKRPRKAVEIFTKLLDEDESNWLARQARGDAFLSVGEHAEAIEDFETALKQRPDDEELLNNLAWVLATSPEDKLRDGRRAVELAKQACELTEYQQAHILSTLAAAYAESGDFAAARKWSKKAVERGAKQQELDEQLKREGQSYKHKKPWRERQQVQEKDDPVQPVHSRFEA